MRVMKELVNTGSIYLSLQSGPANARLLHNIASYLTAILRVFGVISDSSPIGFPLATTQSSENMEEVVMPYLSLLAGFREDVRKKALEVKDGDLLRVCDELRDRKLGDLGVRMEDKEEGTVVKVVGRDAIQRERELERQVQQEKAKAKAEQKRRLEEAKVRGVCVCSRN
jgi:cysteinyl-tRNA synthetase